MSHRSPDSQHKSQRGAKSKTSMQKSKKSRKARLNMSMIEKRAVLCDDCHRRTIDRVSCATSRIEHGGGNVTKRGTSVKSNRRHGKSNLYSSRLGADIHVKLDGSTISHQSMFNMSMVKRNPSHLSSQMS